MVKTNPKIAVVMPRGMHFGPVAATSIDLCALDFVTYSTFYNSTAVFCEEIESSFNSVETIFHRNTRELGSNLLEYRPDLVVVHQHLPTAYRLCNLLKDTPVLLHKHNFISPKKGFLRRLKYSRQYKALAGIIFVSNSCKNAFSNGWPNVETPLYVVHNGLDSNLWNPNKIREKTIIFAGRLSPEKGVLDLVKAANSVLPKFPDWKLRLICSEANEFPKYKEAVFQCIQPISSQVEFLINQPFGVVKSHFENAGIAVVPSRFEEPFGRTAIEAFAGGSALITSGTGGLTEVVADAAITLPNMTIESLSQALEQLIISPDLRESLSHKGRLRLESQFFIGNISGNLDEIYRQYTVYKSMKIGL